MVNNKRAKVILRLIIVSLQHQKTTGFKYEKKGYNNFISR